MAKTWLLITTDFLPQTGGVARYYRGLVNTLSSAKVLTDVLARSRDDNDNIIRRQLSNRYFWPYWLPLLWLIPHYKIATGARLCAAGQILPIGTVLWLINLAFGWPYWVFIHGYDLGLARLNRRKRFLAKNILRRADLVIANSEYTSRQSIELGAVSSRTIVLYPSTDLAVSAVNHELADKVKQQYQLDEQLIVLTVARLVKRKNVARVIKAISALQAEFGNLRHVVVGDGPEIGNLRQLASELKAPVIFTGTISDAELIVWYNLCDVFVLTPIDDNIDIEGFGIVYVEAQAAAKPVIGTMVGGVPEAVGNAGYLINQHADLVSCLRGLLSDAGLRRRFGAIGRRRVSEKFNWLVQAAKLSNKLLD